MLQYYCIIKFDVNTRRNLGCRSVVMLSANSSNMLQLRATRGSSRAQHICQPTDTLQGSSPRTPVYLVFPDLTDTKTSTRRHVVLPSRNCSCSSRISREGMKARRYVYAWLYGSDVARTTASSGGICTLSCLASRPESLLASTSSWLRFSTRSLSHSTCGVWPNKPQRNEVSACRHELHRVSRVDTTRFTVHRCSPGHLTFSMYVFQVSSVSNRHERAAGARLSALKGCKSDQLLRYR